MSNVLKIGSYWCCKMSIINSVIFEEICLIFKIKEGRMLFNEIYSNNVFYLRDGGGNEINWMKHVGWANGITIARCRAFIQSI